jgi:hypothetical protein
MVVPLRQTTTEPIGIFILDCKTFVALIVLFLDMKCLANPERTRIVFMSALSRQKETNAAHQGLPGRSPTDFKNFVTQYPPLFPTSFVPTKPYAMFLTLSPSV